MHQEEPPMLRRRVIRAPEVTAPSTLGNLAGQQEMSQEISCATTVGPRITTGGGSCVTNAWMRTPAGDRKVFSRPLSCTGEGVGGHTKGFREYEETTRIGRT